MFEQASLDYINKLIAEQRFMQARYVCRFLHATHPKFMTTELFDSIVDKFKYIEEEIINEECVQDSQGTDAGLRQCD